ncbi:unnamed protein product [Arctogadus glacialis]
MAAPAAFSVSLLSYRFLSFSRSLLFAPRLHVSCMCLRSHICERSTAARRGRGWVVVVGAGVRDTDGTQMEMGDIQSWPAQHYTTHTQRYSHSLARSLSLLLSV